MRTLFADVTPILTFPRRGGRDYEKALPADAADIDRRTGAVLESLLRRW